jgi:hypothetical protein
MNRRLRSVDFLACCLAAGLIALASGAASAAGPYVVDQDASKALTTYLHKHRLPLVGAQVLEPDAGGRRRVMLYGYVASEFGRTDAERKARKFIKEDDVGLINRIMIRPELLNRGRSVDSGDGGANAP